MIMVFIRDFEKLLFSKTRRIDWLIPFGVVLGPLLIGRINPDYYLVIVSNPKFILSYFILVLNNWN